MDRYFGVFTTGKKIDFSQPEIELLGHSNETESIKAEKYITLFSKKNDNSFYFHKEEKIVVLFFGRICSFKEDSSSNIAQHICELYLKKQEKFIREISGAFSIVIIDLKNNQFRAFRDHIGMRPFFYLIQGETIYFSSEIGLLKEAAPFNLTLNKKRAIYFITHICGEEKQTFYNEISRLSPAGILDFNKDYNSQKKYHFLNIQNLGLKQEEAAKTLKILLVKSIKLLLKDNRKVGSKLSGGLDSSSISSILKKDFDLDLQLFSGVYKLKDKNDFIKTDELEYIKSFEDEYKVKSNQVTFVEGKEIDPFLYDSDDDEPNFIMNRYFDQKFLNILNKKKIPIVFDGFDGDSIITYGTNLFYDLGKKFDLYNLFKQKKLCEQRGTIKKLPNIKFFVRYVLIPNLPSAGQKFLDFMRGREKTEEKNYRVLSKTTQQRYKLNELNSSLGLNYYGHIDSKELHKKVLEWPVWGLILEHNFYDSSKKNIEELFPFMDKELMNFALSIETNHKLSNGYTRNVLREAMKEYLPQKIYKRARKSSLAPAIDNYFAEIKRQKKYLNDLISEDSPLFGMLHKDQVLNIYTSKKVSDNQLLMNLISLNRWMKRNNLKWES